jgi:plasmid replication initiation protein
MPQDQQMTRQGTEERNIARLTPVLALNRVSAGMIGWKKSVQVDGLGAIEVSCTAGRSQVVPHGIDADVIFALTTLYHLQGKPAYGTVTASVAELCEAVGLSQGAPMYARIRESLDRLISVKYEVIDCWASPTRQGKWNFSSLKFGIVNGIQQIDADVSDDVPLGQYRATTLLKVSLSPELLGSLSAGHVRVVDLDFYARLDQPMSRLLYRTLEEQRNLPGVNPDAFHVPLMAWGDHLGLRGLAAGEDPAPADAANTARIPDTEVLRPDKIRRALAPAHEELRSKGYLKTIDYVGRGREQRLDYTFGTPTRPVDLDLVALLTVRGISAPAAEKLVRTQPEPVIHAAVRKFDARKKGGYLPRNPGGLLADMLKDPAKYPELDAPDARQVLNPVRAVPEAQALPVPERAAGQALMALGRRFEETARLRTLRDEAVKHYLAQRVGITDLIQLASLEPAQMERLMAGWTTGA